MSARPSTRIGTAGCSSSMCQRGSSTSGPPRSASGRRRSPARGAPAMAQSMVGGPRCGRGDQLRSRRDSPPREAASSSAAFLRPAAARGGGRLVPQREVGASARCERARQSPSGSTGLSWAPVAHPTIPVSPSGSQHRRRRRSGKSCAAGSTLRQGPSIPIILDLRSWVALISDGGLSSSEDLPCSPVTEPGRGLTGSYAAVTVLAYRLGVTSRTVSA